MEHTKKPLIAVVGAGIAGLSAAYTLKKAGLDVVVYETQDHVGGRMSSRTKDNLIFDYGADFLADNYETLKLYARELGIDWIPTMPGGRHRVIKNGVPYYLDAPGIRGILSLDVLPFFERIRLLLFVIKLRFIYPDLSLFKLWEIPERYDFDNVMSFFEKTIGINAMHYLADSFTGAMQFHRTDDISTAALIAQFKMMTTPAKDFHLRYTRGGIDMIAREIAKKVSVRTDTPASHVQHNADGTVNLTIGNDTIQADAVLVATNSYDASQLLSDATPAQKELFEGSRYSATIVIAFKIPATLFSDGTHCTYVPYIENTLISGYTNEMRKGDNQRDRDVSLLHVYLHEDRARELMDTPDDEIYQLVADELKTVSPEVQLLTLLPHDIHRWPYAMPKFYHGWPTIVSRFLKNNQGEHNIYLIGDWLCAPWTEGAALLGKKTAETIAKRF
ncbi:MAG: NAD(P)/FAD-dependent oxidoreductase [bacterium]|nr:NAD(P)/FAD-dependent oxidoreductase [bacterium]